MIEYLSSSEYEKLFSKLKGSLRVCFSDIGISPYDTEEERKEKLYKAFNPDLPIEIVMHTSEGTITYRRGRK